MEHWEISSNKVNPPAYSNAKVDTNTDLAHSNPQ